MITLALDSSWDLTLDRAGNLTPARDLPAVLQDVASACRLFYDELWYGEPRGIRYFTEILGQYQPIALLRARLVAAALTVPGVLAATVALSALDKRALSGQVEVTTIYGAATLIL